MIADPNGLPAELTLFAPWRRFVPMRVGDRKSPWDPAPDGWREETDAEYRTRFRTMFCEPQDDDAAKTG